MDYINFIIIGLCVLLALLSLPTVLPKLKKNKTSLPADLHIKKNFLTNRERAFYKKLCGLVEGGDLIMCQVRLVDVIQINPKYKKNYKSYLYYFRKISQWHCDFVVLDASLNVKYVIELDDKSHNRPERIRRDNYFNSALTQAGVRLLRFDNVQNLNKEAL